MSIKQAILDIRIIRVDFYGNRSWVDVLDFIEKFVVEAAVKNKGYTAPYARVSQTYRRFFVCLIS